MIEPFDDLDDELEIPVDKPEHRERYHRRKGVIIKGYEIRPVEFGEWEVLKDDEETGITISFEPVKGIWLYVHNIKTMGCQKHIVKVSEPYKSFALCVDAVIEEEKVWKEKDEIRIREIREKRAKAKNRKKVKK